MACGGDPVVHGNGPDLGAGGTSSGGTSSSGGNGSGNGPSVEVDGGNEGGEGNEDPCASANPPEDCFNIEPSGPRLRRR